MDKLCFEILDDEVLGAEPRDACKAFPVSIALRPPNAQTFEGLPPAGTVINMHLRLSREKAYALGLLLITEALRCG